MKNTLIVTVSNREPVREFQTTVDELRRLGALYQKAPGWSDIAQARAVALSISCNILRDRPDRDVLLCIDDDMCMQPETAQDLVNVARLSGEACSGVYAAAEHDGQSGTIAGRRMTAPELERTGKPGNRWLMGMGCMAIPAALLLKVEQESRPFQLRGQTLREMTWSAVEGAEWCSEDYRFCLRLGGVRVLPLAVGHKKPYVLWPDPATLDEIRELDAAGQS